MSDICEIPKNNNQNLNKSLEKYIDFFQNTEPFKDTMNKVTPKNNILSRSDDSDKSKISDKPVLRNQLPADNFHGTNNILDIVNSVDRSEVIIQKDLYITNKIIDSLKKKKKSKIPTSSDFTQKKELLTGRRNSSKTMSSLGLGTFPFLKNASFNIFQDENAESLLVNPENISTESNDCKLPEEELFPDDFRDYLQNLVSISDSFAKEIQLCPDCSSCCEEKGEESLKSVIVTPYIDNKSDTQKVGEKTKIINSSNSDSHSSYPSSVIDRAVANLTSPPVQLPLKSPKHQSRHSHHSSGDNQDCTVDVLTETFISSTKCGNKAKIKLREVQTFKDKRLPITFSTDTSVHLQGSTGRLREAIDVVEIAKAKLALRDYKIENKSNTEHSVKLAEILTFLKHKLLIGKNVNKIPIQIESPKKSNKFSPNQQDGLKKMSKTIKQSFPTSVSKTEFNKDVKKGDSFNKEDIPEEYIRNYLNKTSNLDSEGKPLRGSPQEIEKMLGVSKAGSIINVSTTNQNKSVKKKMKNKTGKDKTKTHSRTKKEMEISTKKTIIDLTPVLEENLGHSPKTRTKNVKEKKVKKIANAGLTSRDLEILKSIREANTVPEKKINIKDSKSSKGLEEENLKSKLYWSTEKTQAEIYDIVKIPGENKLSNANKEDKYLPKRKLNLSVGKEKENIPTQHRLQTTYEDDFVNITGNILDPVVKIKKKNITPIDISRDKIRSKEISTPRTPIESDNKLKFDVKERSVKDKELAGKNGQNVNQITKFKFQNEKDKDGIAEQNINLFTESKDQNAKDKDGNAKKNIYTYSKLKREQNINQTEKDKVVLITKDREIIAKDKELITKDKQEIAKAKQTSRRKRKPKKIKKVKERTKSAKEELIEKITRGYTQENYPYKADATMRNQGKKTDEKEEPSTSSEHNQKSKFPIEKYYPTVSEFADPYQKVGNIVITVSENKLMENEGSFLNNITFNSSERLVFDQIENKIPRYLLEKYCQTIAKSPNTFKGSDHLKLPGTSKVDEKFVKDKPENHLSQFYPNKKKEEIDEINLTKKREQELLYPTTLEMSYPFRLNNGEKLSKSEIEKYYPNVKASLDPYQKAGEFIIAFSEKEDKFDQIDINFTMHLPEMKKIEITYDEKEIVDKIANELIQKRFPHIYSGTRRQEIIESISDEVLKNQHKKKMQTKNQTEASGISKTKAEDKRQTVATDGAANYKRIAKQQVLKNNPSVPYIQSYPELPATFADELQIDLDKAAKEGIPFPDVGVKKQVPNIDSKLLLQFPLLNSTKMNYETPTDGIICLDCNVNPLIRTKLRAFPSVTRVLNSTMSIQSIAALTRWRDKMISQLGESGFQEFYKGQIESGADFHNGVKKHFRGISQDLSNSPNLALRSISNLTEHISEVSVVESHVFHQKLSYRGVIDCVAKYKNKPVLIEWKRSDKKKALLDNTFDAPLQLCAYIGALNYDENYKLKVEGGLVVVAYSDGSPADVFTISMSECQIYWKKWLSRLHQFLLDGETRIL